MNASGTILAAAIVAVACSSGTSSTWPSTDSHLKQTDAVGFCDAFAVMQDKCLRCHADPPENGAPFALDSYEATQVRSSRGTPRSDQMHKVVESGFMPLTSLELEPPVEALTCEERATILAWVEAGAAPPPDGDPGCEHTPTALVACDP